MADNSPDSIKNSVIGGVLTAAVLGIGGAIWAFVPDAWKWFTDLLGSAWEHLTSPATVPTWSLYVLYTVGAAALLVVALIVRESFKKTGPSFTDYEEDRFFGVVWRWGYAHGRPTGTWAFCPSCDTVLVYSYRYDYGHQKTTLHCETCNHDLATESGDKDDIVAKVHRQIDRKIRTGEWKNLERTMNAKSEAP
jgi:ribosomal protein S27E